MRIGIVDIGTNSMRLLIADYENNNIFNRQKYVEVTRIGKNVDKNKMISKEAIQKNSKILKRFVDMAKESHCEKINAIGTSALRDSKNSDEFVKEAFALSGVKVDIISGELEANLGFLGVKSILDKKDYTLTIDIGGGSTEFILGDKEGNLIFSKSEDIGCVRLTEKFLKEKIATLSEIKYLNEYIDMITKKTIEMLKTYKIGKFIGIGGTATSISSMLQKLSVYSSEKVHNSKIYYDELLELYNEIKTKTLEEKKVIVGLQPQRADVIFAGICILKNIMEKLNANHITVSEYDNLEGLIYYIME